MHDFLESDLEDRILDEKHEYEKHSMTFVYGVILFVRASVSVSKKSQFLIEGNLRKYHS